MPLSRFPALAGTILIAIAIGAQPAVGLASSVASPAPSAETDAKASLRLGEVADYRVTNETGAIVSWVNASVEGVTECRDGINRTFECLDVREKTGRPGGGAPDTEEEMFGVSLTHAETISQGSWPAGDVGTFDTQYFAAIYRPFPGYPLPYPGSNEPGITTSERAFAIAALAVPLRAETSGAGTSTFSGIEGEIRTSTDANGSLVAEAVFEATRENATYRYSSTMGDDGGFPDTFSLERTTNGTTSLILTAERIHHEPGSENVDFGTWEPIDVHAQRDDAAFLAWDKHPPTSGEAFFYPIEEAYERLNLDPDAREFREDHPDAYVTRGIYDRRTVHIGVPFLRGDWFLMESTPNASQLVSETVRDIPRTVHENTKDRTPHGTGVDTFDANDNGRTSWFAPARSELPDKVIAAEDAWKVGRSAIGSEDIENTELVWDAAVFPRMMGTAEEVSYRVHCEEFGGPTAWINAATGGVFVRNTIFQASCE
jgi:hypothetical protein